MVEPLGLLRDRAQENWLIGLDRQQLAHLAEIRYQELQAVPAKIPPTILICESDPLAFLASFLAACAAECPLFLGNPQWGQWERQQVMEQVQPDLVWGSVEEARHLEKTEPPRHQDTKIAPFKIPNPKSKIQNPKSPPQPGWIMIPTGGSSGQIRFAIHTWKTLTASVTGFRQYFQVEQVNSCCVLPLYHVSGLMQFIRSLLSGGEFAHLPGKATELGQEIAAITPSKFFLSLVPTQLQRLLQIPTSIEWLSQFHIVLLGGAPAWTELLAAAKHSRIRLAPTYGMTETASQVATLKPEEFLRGRTGSGQPLPHAQMTIRDEQGRSLPPNQIGIVTIQASSLALGYFPQCFNHPEFQTDDLGYLDPEGNLHIVGRSSHKIITGGENVFPTEVEAAIRSTGLVNDVCVLGLPDLNWGEAVTAAYVPIVPDVTIATLQSALASRLSHFKQPKRWLALDQIPRNAQGKVNYESLKRIFGKISRFS